MLHLEDSSSSRRPIKVNEPHFPVFPEFVGASYADRYEIFCRKLVRERKYRAACLILSNQEGGPKGQYTSRAEDVSVRAFVNSLIAHVVGWVSR